MPPPVETAGVLSATALRREQRAGQIAGTVALASVAASFAALILSTSASTPVKSRPGGGVPAADARQQLLDLHHAPGAQAVAAGVRGLAALLVIPLALHLYRATRARTATVPPWTRSAAVAGAILIAIATAIGYITIRAVADDFVAGTNRSSAHARDLINHDASLRVSFWFERVAFLVFGVWLVVASLNAMRCGLLTRAIGIWGMGAGVVSAFLPIGSVLFLGWLASVGLIAMGWWPGGLPPAWEQGKAIRWEDPSRQPPDRG